ncbi:hexameric tyrosine-coordinated heme protein [Chryseobacterium wangxinyae]|uniref:hexameric tyrosine-coordinated heme protein n=1 Tax=Chryseobacterium sp. CY350 TaxID=2997336 RepID=UPI002272183A|nr:hexameric tyrosine-coordinated heme protein [Chryseobacterium sp. CY350]MCY0977191.1 hexameric tyrosine-coordinated heme protein [Chryseobacterium sp. CY350]WBZ95788.1 hexameric tyrosine-coordinated heme protein [Chryseobacterium sp. CY350]
MEEIQLVPDNTLFTKTPEEGRHLAVKMARLVIRLTQPDENKRKKMRNEYADSSLMLIQIGQTVAMEFATIAAANNYWKDNDESIPPNSNK